MNDDLLLDTSVVIGLARRRAGAADLLTGLSGMVLPVVALGELYYGAFRSQRADENLAWVRQFAAGLPLLRCDEATAVHYGRLKNDLRARGAMIPENDLWIAALAVQYDYTVLSSDDHYDRVPGLRVTNPRAADHP